MDTLNGLFGWRDISEDKEVCKVTEVGRQTITCKFIGVLSALAFMLLWTSVISAPIGHAAFPGANGKIVFSSERDGNPEIYVMNADGSGQTRLTNNSAVDVDPAWSADGTKIAFTSTRDGAPSDGEIYVMSADGSGQTRLTDLPGSNGEPAWSPDGTKIVFRSFRDGNSEIYVMNADGTGVTNLTNNPADDAAPNWSPDGTKIVFYSDRDGDYEIHVMNADGTGVTNLTNNPGIDINPNWSPDGTKIAFRSQRDGNLEIYVMNADGTGQTRLTSNAAQEDGPAWSPDGTKIAFSSDRDGNHEIYVMNADGTGQTRVTDRPGNDVSPDWQPLPISVEIDIKPGSDPNSINPRSRGVIPVAIPTTDTFDATTVDETTVLFGATGTEAAPVHFAFEDVDGDGDTDMILHFNTQDTGIVCGDTSASLTGETFGGPAIQGTDSIRTVGCK
jgi:TolB protein